MLRAARAVAARAERLLGARALPTPTEDVAAHGHDPTHSHRLPVLDPVCKMTWERRPHTARTEPAHGHIAHSCASPCAHIPQRGWHAQPARFAEHERCPHQRPWAHRCRLQFRLPVLADIDVVAGMLQPARFASMRGRQMHKGVAGVYGASPWAHRTQLRLPVHTRKEAGVPSLHGSLSTSAARPCTWMQHCVATLTRHIAEAAPWAHGDCNASHFSLGDCTASPCANKGGPWAALRPWAALPMGPVGRSARGPGARGPGGLNAGGTATPLVASLISARSGHPGYIGS